jgi:general secretion pathway protein G
MSYPDEARVTRAQQDIQSLRTALDLYRMDNFSYPSTEQGLGALVTKPGGRPEAPNWRSGGYIKELPKDPWGGDYVYLSPGQTGDFDLYSLGADRAPGGEGAAADIGR